MKKEKADMEKAREAMKKEMERERKKMEKEKEKMEKEWQEIKKEKEGNLSLPPPSYLLFRVCCKYVKFVVKRVILILYYYHLLPACALKYCVCSRSYFAKKTP